LESRIGQRGPRSAEFSRSWWPWPTRALLRRTSPNCSTCSAISPTIRRCPERCRSTQRTEPPPRSTPLPAVSSLKSLPASLHKARNILSAPRRPATQSNCLSSSALAVSSAMAAVPFRPTRGSAPCLCRAAAQTPRRHRPSPSLRPGCLWPSASPASASSPIDGRVHLGLDKGHRPLVGQGPRRPRAALFGGGARLASRQAAARRFAKPLPLLRRDRKNRRR
jgi:hypothetical protein